MRGGNEGSIGKRAREIVDRRVRVSETVREKARERERKRERLKIYVHSLEP